MDKEPDQQDQARDQVQKETQRVEKERPIHIQIKWF